MTANPQTLATLIAAAVVWKHQGARTKWGTPESLALWDAVDQLERERDATPIELDKEISR